MKKILLIILLFSSLMYSQKIEYITKDTTWENKTLSLEYINLQNAHLTLINCKIDLSKTVLGMGILEIKESSKVWMKNEANYNVYVKGDLSNKPITGLYKNEGVPLESLVCYKFKDRSKTILEVKSRDGINKVEIFGRYERMVNMPNFGDKVASINLATFPKNREYKVVVTTQYGGNEISFRFRK